IETEYAISDPVVIMMNLVMVLRAMKSTNDQLRPSQRSTTGASRAPIKPPKTFPANRVLLSSGVTPACSDRTLAMEYTMSSVNDHRHIEMATTKALTVNTDVAEPPRDVAWRRCEATSWRFGMFGSPPANRSPMTPSEAIA